MTIDDFAKRFQHGLDAMASRPLALARGDYDRLCASFATPLPTTMRITDERIAGVPVRRYRPGRVRGKERGTASGRVEGRDSVLSHAHDHAHAHAHADTGQQTVLYVHGGGFTIGSLDSHQGVAAGLAEALGREVVSVQYRLMPETRYSDQLDDVDRVRRWLQPCAMVGDSAGGRLVLDVARAAKDPHPLGMIYPLLGDMSETSLGPDAPLLSRRDAQAAWAMIASDAARVGDAPPVSSTVECLVVEHDPLTPAILATLDQWRQQRRQVGLHTAEGMFHGALHAHAQLAPMSITWRGFCRALACHLGKRHLDYSLR
ncbi:alpha/beta hydrolase [Halomonas sp. DP8Y7-1]|uniref:alpha/beta hydrolase fold domain-containing protein n=1 Tax=Halomonas sp. DP8Y7-1 TaxID=2859078 RepID=UPI001C96BF9F|nr:alpha/beta hydrolase fold domain-containing protein [Halomonas sp. DP8Y7-1]MBY6029597.1 alpha/beta hydrolase [Halomonas sp. DP8Y7-1]